MKSSFRLADLFKDFDYQEEFTYEQRVDYFNKYGISTALPFFTPFYHLAVMIFNYSSFNVNPSYGYGHGKTMLNKGYLREATERKYPYSQYKDLGTKEYMKTWAMQHNRYIKIWAENGEITSIIIDAQGVRLPKENIYEKVEEWLVDFNFKEGRDETNNL